MHITLVSFKIITLKIKKGCHVSHVKNYVGISFLNKLFIMIIAKHEKNGCTWYNVGIFKVVTLVIYFFVLFYLLCKYQKRRKIYIKNSNVKVG